MKHLEIHIGGRQHVSPDEIKLLTADVNYTTIYFLDGTKTLVSTTMGTIQSRLPKNEFIRVNRGTVVNRSAVSHYFIRPDFDEVKLADASFVKVSRRRRMEMRTLLVTQK
jgi:two-component system LytT family response regulator